MEIAGIVGNQIIIMMLLAVVGIVAVKVKWIDAEGSRQLSNLLLMLVFPCLTITAFDVDFDPTKLKGFLFAAILAAFATLVGMVMGQMVFSRGKFTAEKGQERFAMASPNSGYMAVPIIAAIFGPEGVFFASAYSIVFNVYSWTIGLKQLAGKDAKMSVKKIFLNPGMISAIVSLCIYLLQIRIPAPIKSTMTFLGNMTTATSMLVLGTFLAQIDFKSLFGNLRAYWIALVGKLLVVPLICVLTYNLLGLHHLFPDSDFIITLNLLAVASPVAINLSMMSVRMKQDPKYCATLIAVSTLGSVITIPLMMALNSWLSSVL